MKFTETIENRIACRVLEEHPDVKFLSGPRHPYWRIILENDKPSPLGEFTTFPEAVKAFKNSRNVRMTVHGDPVIPGLTRKKAQKAHRPLYGIKLREKRIAEWKEHKYKPTKQDLDNIADPKYLSELEKRLYPELEAMLNGS